MNSILKRKYAHYSHICAPHLQRTTSCSKTKGKSIEIVTEPNIYENDFTCGTNQFTNRLIASGIIHIVREF